MAGTLYLSLYWCPLPCDFKGPSPKRQTLFPCCLISEFGSVCCFGQGDVSSHDTVWGKYLSIFVVLLCFSHSLSICPDQSLGKWEMCGAHLFFPILSAKSSRDQPVASWPVDIWTSPDKYGISASHPVQTVPLTRVLVTLWHWVWGTRCQITTLWK